MSDHFDLDYAGDLIRTAQEHLRRAHALLSEADRIIVAEAA